MDHLHLPVEYVIISHTAQVTTPCATTDDCCATVKEIQEVSMDHSGGKPTSYHHDCSGIIVIPKKTMHMVFKIITVQVINHRA